MTTTHLAFIVEWAIENRNTFVGHTIELPPTVATVTDQSNGHHISVSAREDGVMISQWYGDLRSNALVMWHDPLLVEHIKDEVLSAIQDRDMPKKEEETPSFISEIMIWMRTTILLIGILLMVILFIGLLMKIDRAIQ